MIGNDAALKLALNQLIAGLTSSFALSLAAIAKSGVDIEQFMGILKGSSLYAPTFDKKLSRMVDRNYDNPNFPTKHYIYSKITSNSSSSTFGRGLSGS